MAEDSFRCVKCKQQVDTLSFGTTQRNHCPQCLWSRHVDNFPGDRKAACGGPMEPPAVFVAQGGERMAGLFYLFLGVGGEVVARPAGAAGVPELTQTHSSPAAVSSPPASPVLTTPAGSIRSA